MSYVDMWFRALGAAIAWAIIGLLIALVIKAFRRDRPLPKWPIVVFAVLGVLFSIALRLQETYISN